MLALTNIHYAFGGQQVLSGVSLHVGRAQKAGLAGPNGAGKSTLLRIAAGQVRPDQGRVGRPNSVGYLAQEPELPPHTSSDASVSEVMVSQSPTAALARELARLQRRLATASGRELNQAVEAYGELEERYRSQGGYRVESRAATVLAGLGLGYVELDQPVESLSAGERTRLAVAQVLMKGADLLLLDEPTNHLDEDGTRWLMQFLARTAAAVLLVSHDLRLLDHAISRVFELDPQTHTVEEFTGTHSDYLKWAERRSEVTAKTRRRQLADVDRLQVLADRYRGGSETMARRAKVLDRRVERMRSEVVDAPVKSRELAARFPPAPRSGRVALRAHGIAKAFDARQVLRAVGFQIERGQRLVVLGVNGAGKSTVLNILADRLEPDAGEVRRGHGVSLGYFAHRFDRDGDRLSAYEHLEPLVVGGETAIRAVLARLSFGPDHVFRPVRTLSSGERARLGIAKLMLERHNLLVLDEPSSNLDARTCEWLLAALDECQPSLIVVSHDREFVRGLRPDWVLRMPDEALERFADRHLAVTDQV